MTPRWKPTSLFLFLLFPFSIAAALNSTHALQKVTHVTHEFSSAIAQHEYFPYYKSILVRLYDGSIWQSRDGGSNWTQLEPQEHFVKFYHHPHLKSRAYLLTNEAHFYTTSNAGLSWNKVITPAPPSTFTEETLVFQIQSNYLIWIGDVDCGSESLVDCHASAWYSIDNGLNWQFLESFVRNCVWSTDILLYADLSGIICESYSIKEGSQVRISPENRLGLVFGGSFYTRKQKLFDEVAGFTKLSSSLTVVEVDRSRYSLDLHVSHDGQYFDLVKLPFGARYDPQAYNMVDTFGHPLVVHIETSQFPFPGWGSALKSDSRGSNVVTIAENVNRDGEGVPDFERMVGLEGTAFMNVVSNPREAVLTGIKSLQTKISHDDGSTWKYLEPPRLDSLGNSYGCSGVSCNLHLQGPTQRKKHRTPGASSIHGLIIGIGNVGEELGSYSAGDVFLSRDGGFTWEEIHKEPHIWEFGNSGSLLVMAHNGRPTNHVIFSTDLGLTWAKHQFAEEELLIHDIITNPSGTSRRFIVLGKHPLHPSKIFAIKIDFSSLITRECNSDRDFEFWSPYNHGDNCILGKQMLYHRRIRDVNCVVDEQQIMPPQYQGFCLCTRADFDCQFNHVRNETGDCTSIPGAPPLDYDPTEQCRYRQSYQQPSAYRINPLSHCWGGEELDIGPEIPCPVDPTEPTGPSEPSEPDDTTDPSPVTDPTDPTESRISRFWVVIIFAIFFSLVILVGACRRRKSAIQLPSDSDIEIDDESQSFTAARSYNWPVSIVRRLAGFSRNRRQGSISLPLDSGDVQQNGA
ncbi:vacuolar protein sorting/targeting protein PEP1 [Stygiomarasmius scandens]|uniref:Vacuolar protein sorting/targeting protein PEP1 n=1 Tax=Marasmiellus scandens TaxID=2682957 RepID=A0ABR1JDV8_9AGAR